MSWKSPATYRISRRSKSAIEPRAERVLVRVLRLGEAAQVADHHQDVLVDRVHVEQVVLHLPDDPAEHRQVLAEDPVEVHPAQLVQQSALGVEHRDEARAVGRIAAERRVDQLPVAPQRAQRARGHALQLAVPLHHQERVQHRRRAPQEEIGIGDVEQLVDLPEVVVDRHGLGGRRVEPRVHVVQQHGVDLAHQFRRAVVPLHQLLARALRARVDEPELRRQRALRVEHQPVLAPAQQVVEPDAHRADQALLPRHGARLAGRHEAVARELAPRAAQAGRARYPQHRLQVAQAAGALLDVGLEVVDRVLVLQVPLLLLERLRRVERAHVHQRVELRAEPAEQRPRAAQEAVFEQARAHGDVGDHLGLAFAERAHGVRQLDADVPQRREEALDRRRRRRAVRGQQHEHVDVGVREELPAAVAADGERREVLGHPALGPDAAQHAIDEARVVAQEPRRVGRREERGAQRARARRAVRSARMRRAAPPSARRRDCAGDDRGRRGGHGRAARQAASAGGAGAPSETVSTS